MFARVPKEREPYIQTEIPYWYGPVKDANGNWINSHIMNQDFIAWAGQGTTADRTREHLGRSDRGIVMMRKRFLDDIETIREGNDPKTVIRDLERNCRVKLPVVGRELLLDGLTLDQIGADPARAGNVTPGSYVFQAGQPEPVRRAMQEALGREITLDGVVKGG
jgi:5,5'-dehydrodivanillate O-demethylase oxygenase subunit